jgi:hypothetical protein
MSERVITITLEYIGPPGQVMFDADGKQVSLVAGRRYPVEASLAAYRLERDHNYWKRPDPPQPAAAKE